MQLFSDETGRGLLTDWVNATREQLDASPLAAQLREGARVRKQPTMAAPGCTYAFETVDVSPSFRCTFINQLNWDETTLPRKGGYKLVDVDFTVDTQDAQQTAKLTDSQRADLEAEWELDDGDGVARTRFVRLQRQVRAKQRHPWYGWTLGAPGEFVSEYRDDETFHRLSNGQVILLALLPRRTATDGKGRTVGAPDTEWRWTVVLCDEVVFPLDTAAAVKRLQRLTGITASTKRGGSRRVMMASERLYRTWHESDLDDARDDAYRWFREMELLDEAAMDRGGQYTRLGRFERPMDSDVIQRVVESQQAAFDEPVGTIGETWELDAGWVPPSDDNFGYEG